MAGGGGGWQPALVLRDDVELAVRIDVGHVPVTIHLEGTLDERTGATVVPVVSELISEGTRSFELETSELRAPDAGGTAILAEIRQTIRASGGCLL